MAAFDFMTVSPGRTSNFLFCRLIVGLRFCNPQKGRTSQSFFGQRRCPRLVLPSGKKRCSEKSRSTALNALVTLRDQWALATPMAASPDCANCVRAGIRCPHEVGPMSSHVELCEHHAKDCLQAAEKTEDPFAREMLLRHALEWMRDGLAASKQSKLCAVCGRKAAPGSSLVH